MALRKTTSRRRSPAVWWAALTLAVALGGFVWWSFGETRIDPSLADRFPRSWAKLESWREEHPRARVAHVPVPLSAVSPDLVAAVIAGEDAGFFVHGALDFASIHEALEEYVDGRRLRGASTITQQLAKNLFLSDERTLARKLQEARLAFWLEERLSKRRILALYLNVIEFGEGVFGVEAAARHYFGVSASGLSEAQAVALAATIPNPRFDNPTTATRAWARRRDAIAARLEAYPRLRQRLARR